MQMHIILHKRPERRERDTKPDGTVVSTLWGEIAWQLGGADAYQLVAEADRTGTNPGSPMTLGEAACTPR